MWRSSAAIFSCVWVLFTVPAFAQQQSGNQTASQPTQARDNRIKVTSVTLNGVKEVPVSQVKAAIATTASSKLPWGAKHYFNRRQFEADLKRIQVFYNDRGYPDARVASFDLKLNNTQDAIAVTFNSNEGEPIVVQSVNFTGFDAIPPAHFARMKAQAPLKAGMPLDRANLQTTRENTLDELRDHGYPRASVKIQQTAGNSPRTVNITYAADAGQLSYFGPIDVQGNSSVSDRVVRRELTYKPGDLFQISQIQESQRRLYGLELFQFVNIEPATEVPATPSAEIPTHVTVTETKHRKVTLGGGYGSEEHLRGDFDWTHVNFFGGARTAGVTARWSSLDRGVRLNFEQPFVFTPRFSLRAEAESWHTAETVYTLNNSGGRITLERHFAIQGPYSTSSLKSTASVGFLLQKEDYSIANVALQDLSFRDTLIALRLDPRFGTGQGTLAALDFDYERTTTRNPLDARKGYYWSAHFEQAGRWLPGTYDFNEYTTEGRHYLSFGPITWANKLRVSAITGPEPIGEHVPFYKRYFLGGATSLRGWGRFEVSPLSASGLPLGGHSALEGSSELRMRVWGNFGAVLFADAGNSWADQWHFDPHDLRYDIGPGLRYRTPIGPIRFDIGYQINPIPGLLVNGVPQTRRYRMHFSIGQAF